MFNMGFTEILVLAAIALVVIGPKQIPEVARTIARFLNELKRATGDIGSSLMDTKKDAQRAWEETRDAIDPAQMFSDDPADEEPSQLDSPDEEYSAENYAEADHLAEVREYEERLKREKLQAQTQDPEGEDNDKP